MMFFRVIGRLTLRFLTAVGRAVVRHPLSALISLAIVFAVVALLTLTNIFDNFTLFSSASADCSTLSRTNASQQAEPDTDVLPAATQVMNGITSFDAAKVWDGLSICYRNDLQKSGVTTAVLQTRLNSLRDDSKMQALGTRPSGSLKFPDGHSISIISVFLQTPDDSGQNSAATVKPQAVEVDFFTGHDGKVYVVDTQNAMISSLFRAASDVAADGSDDCKQAPPPDPNASKRGISDLSGVPGSGDYYHDANGAQQLMDGMSAFNAKKAWDGLSVCFQRELQAGGTTVDILQKRLDTLRTDGNLGVVGYALRDGLKFPDGRGAYEYVDFQQQEAKTDDGKFSSLNSAAMSQDIIIYTNAVGKVYLITSKDPLLNALYSDPGGTPTTPTQ